MRTGTVSYRLEDLKNGVIIPIGFVGENDFTKVFFDAEEIYKKYPNASVSMKVQPPKGVIYPATVTRDGNAVIWQVKEADVANRGGGELQLTFTDGETKIKTYIARTDVKRSLAGNGPAPDPVQDWIDDADEKLAEVDDALADLAAMDNIAKNAQESDIGKSLSPKTVVDGVVTEWQYTEPSGGTDDYTDLDNKPQIAGVTLSGNKTLEDLGIASEESLGELSGEVTNVKTAIQGKYTKPSGGIPSTDMTQAVQDALADAESAYQKPSGGIPASDIADGVIPVVDSALSYSSENAVQNKVVKGALDTKAPVIINTATGNPAVFNDGGGMPIKSILIPITPKQTGSGDPSPSNIRPILPWSGMTVFGGGKNLLNPAKRNDSYTNIQYYKTDGLFLSKGTYTISKTGDSCSFFIKRLSDDTQLAYKYATTSSSFTLESDETVWINLYKNGGIDNDSQIQLEAGSTASTYEEYRQITETDISFPAPVYGGEYEAVSGKLMDGWKVETLDDANAWTQGAYISYTNHDFNDRRKGSSWTGLCSVVPIREGVASGTAFARWGDADAGNFIISPNGSGLTLEDVKTLSGQGKIVLAYPLATPTEQTLTGHQITALIGNNTIWSDTDGQMTVEYPADTETFIANQHRNFIAPELSSMIADTALVKNDFRIVGNDLYKITTAIASGGTLTPNTNCVKTTLAEVIKPLLT